MKRFNKQNCTSSVRAQITDKWGPFRPICNYELHSDRDLREGSK